MCALVTALRRSGYSGKIDAWFSDMDILTINDVCIPFVKSALVAFQVDTHFCAASWDDLNCGNAYFNVILSSECVYREDLFQSHSQCISRLLSKDGLAFVAAKRYYFGCGGGTIGFSDYCSSFMTVDLVETFENGFSNTREILELKAKP